MQASDSVPFEACTQFAAVVLLGITSQGRIQRSLSKHNDVLPASRVGKKSIGAVRYVRLMRAQFGLRKSL